MKRRNFVKKATLGTVTVGGVLNAFGSIEEHKETKEIKSENESEVESSLVDEIMQTSYKARGGVSLGGIGTGGMELRKDGIFYNWRIFNNAHNGRGAEFSFPENGVLFFIVRYQEEGKEPAIKLLQIEDGQEVGTIPNQVYEFPWLSGVDTIEYDPKFPFANLKFTDPKMPLEIEMEVYSPFIPSDIKNSALPALNINFKIKSLSEVPVDVNLIGSFRNCVGYDVEDKLYISQLEVKGNAKICTMSCTGMDLKHSSYGSMSLASLSPESTHYLGWQHHHPYYEIVLREKALPNIDDTPGRNIIDKNSGKAKAMKRAFSSLAVSKSLKSKQSFDHSFVYSWYFPNAYNGDKSSFEGTYYSNFFGSSSAVAEYLNANKETLHKNSRNFLNDFYDSSIEMPILNLINSNLGILVTDGWLNKKGEFGLSTFPEKGDTKDKVTTVDFAMITSPIACLFPQLFKNMIKLNEKVIGNGLNNSNGSVEVANALTGKVEKEMRLDVPLHFVIMLLRDYYWTNDTSYLQSQWGNIVKAIDFVAQNFDKDLDGVPELAGEKTCFEGFPLEGLNPYLTSLWISALTGFVDAAGVLKDIKVQVKYSIILDKARKVFEQKLWNGKYFRLSNNSQVGKINEGCFIGQLYGQWTNKLCGWGNIAPEKKIISAIKSIHQMSFTEGVGVVNCSWDESLNEENSQDTWLNQANSSWLGAEIGFASLLFYYGMYKEGMSLLNTLNKRYIRMGKYWELQNIGRQNILPLNAWNLLNAFLGMEVKNETFTFSPVLPGNYYKVFFTLPGITAHFSKNYDLISIKVLTGKITFSTLVLPDVNISGKNVRVFVENKPTVPHIKYLNVAHPTININFDEALEIGERQTLKIYFR